MKKAIGYIRVSTTEQAQEGVSLDAQRARIEKWCIDNGYELTEIFVDAGISGKNIKNRPGLQKSLKAVKKGNAMVVYSLSRLARSVKDALTISEQLQKKTADLVSLSESIDTTTAAGKLMFQMMAVLAEFERNLTAERTATALAHKKAQGEVYSPTPFGFEAVNGRLAEVEAEAALVAEIMQAREQGATLKAIAEDLNTKGIKGKQGGKWYPSTIRYLINRQEAA